MIELSFFNHFFLILYCPAIRAIARWPMVLFDRDNSEARDLSLEELRHLLEWHRLDWKWVSSARRFDLVAQTSPPMNWPDYWQISEKEFEELARLVNDLWARLKQARVAREKRKEERARRAKPPKPGRGLFPNRPAVGEKDDKRKKSSVAKKKRKKKD